MSKGLNYRRVNKHRQPKTFNTLDMLSIIAVILFILIYLLSNVDTQADTYVPLVKEPPIVVTREVAKGGIDIEADVHTLVDNEQLEMLAHLIYAESGSSWCSDEMQLYVGSVVLNRIKSDVFPNTMKEVIEQNGQYAVRSYYMSMNIDERAYNNALYLLINGSQLPDNVVFQSNFKQGHIYKQVQNMYFCCR